MDGRVDDMVVRRLRGVWGNTYEIEPLVGAHCDPAANPQLLDLAPRLRFLRQQGHSLNMELVRAVAAPVIRDDPRDADLGGGLENVRLYFWRGPVF